MVLPASAAKASMSIAPLRQTATQRSHRAIGERHATVSLLDNSPILSNEIELKFPCHYSYSLETQARR
jgi:hypothetical protein